MHPSHQEMLQDEDFVEYPPLLPNTLWYARYQDRFICTVTTIDEGIYGNLIIYDPVQGREIYNRKTLLLDDVIKIVVANYMYLYLSHPTTKIWYD